MISRSMILFGAWLLAAVLALAPCGAAAGEEAGEPLWEVGLVGVVGWLPDYPAADQNHLRWLVVPRVVYRGPILRLGEKGLIRGLLVETERVELDVSLTGSFAADADDNRARRGMPDHDWLGEIGPRLTVGLVGERERRGLAWICRRGRCSRPTSPASTTAAWSFTPSWCGAQPMSRTAPSGWRRASGRFSPASG